MLRHDHGHKAIKNLVLLSPALLLLTAIGTGCGMSYAPANAAGSTSSYSSSGTDSSASTSGVPTTSAATTSGGGGQAPYQINIQGSGYDSHSVTLSTGTTLKVRFIAGKQSQETGGQFYPYSMLGVYVGVGSNLQPTEMVYNGYGGYPAEQSSVIDLSQFVGSGCNSSNPTCRQSVTITVTQPNNDDACLNQSVYYCPYNHVPDGHPWNGTLVVQTDDTTSI